jgi:hypothetical protein
VKKAERRPEGRWILFIGADNKLYRIPLVGERKPLLAQCWGGDKGYGPFPRRSLRERWR